MKFIEEERGRLSKQLDVTTRGVGEEMGNLRAMMRKSGQARAEGENKLHIMLSELEQELGKAIEQESKEGEMTYDCLLKLVEDSCTRIREAQLH